MKTKNEILNLKKELQLKEELIAKLLLDVENSKSNNMADITDMESAEQELNKSDDKYKTVIQFLQEGIIIQDKNGYFTDANESALLILGISLEQLLGLTAFDPMWGAIKEDGSDFPVEEYPITLSFKEGIALNNIIMGIHKPNGELIWTTINSKPIINPLNNEIIGSVASFKDITHQKVINDDLDRNLKLLEESQSISKLGGWELDLITGNLYWTAETYKLHETIPEEFNPTVDVVVGYYLPESKVILVKALELATTLGTGYDLYLQTNTVKGRLIDVRTTCKVTMVDGKPIKLTGIFQDITEQKIGEEKQRKTDEKYKTVVATLHEGIAIHDENLSITEANKSAEEMLGLTLDQMQGRITVDESWKTIREDGSEFTSNTRPAMITLQTGKTLTNQIMGVYKPNGNLTWISINTVPMYGDGSDKPNGVLASFKDITEQKTLELNLKNEKEKYKLLFDINPMPISVFDAETLQYLNVNEAFCEKYGYSLEEILKLTILDIRPKEEIDSFLISIKPNVPGLVNFGIYTHQKRNKELIKVEIIRHEIIYEGRRAKLVLANDVTEKLKIEEEIIRVNKSALDFKNAVYSASIISKTNIEGNIILVNQNFIEISGYSESELIGKNHRMINSGFHKKEFWAEMWSTVLSGRTWRNEVKNRAKNGTYYWVDTFIIPFINSDGEVTQLLSIRNDITIRKKIEEELILNKKAVESSLEGIVIADVSQPDFPLIYINDRFTELTGYTKEDAIGNNCRFLQGPGSVGETLDRLRKAIKDKKDFEGELINYKKDGTKFWNNLRITTIKNAEGEVTHFVGLQNDITIRKNIEVELMLNKKAVESSLEGIAISDSNQPDFPLIYINDRFTELTGYTKEDAIGKNSRFLQGPDSAGETLDRLRKAIVEKNDFEGELINYKKDGTKFWNHLRITTIKNAKGKVTNHVFFQNDITIRKNNEMLLIERGKSLEDIFNFSPVPFVIAKISDGEIIMVNNSLVKLLGENANDLIGKFTHQFYVSKIDKNEILKEIEETGELNNIDLILKTKTGEEIECLTSSKKIKLNDEYVNLISFLDIRKIKETEMTLIKAKESAEEMSRLKSSFLANMSHELRTPMNGIIGFSDFMKSVDDIEEVKEISELIYSSAQRLMETLNLILDISTIESGVNKLVYNDLDIIQLIKDNIELFSKFANSKNLSLTLKSKYEEFIIKSNQKALYSILSNLISNAIKYTLKGGITIELDMISEDDKLSNNKKCVILKVHDTGIGIEEKYFTTIFEEFRQVSEGINRNFEGSGLGLTLTKKYVQVMGGEINVESEIDKGTTFTIKLPIEER